MNKLYTCLLFFLFSIPQIDAQSSQFVIDENFIGRGNCLSGKGEMLHWNLDAQTAVFGLSGIGTVGLNTQVQAAMFQNPGLLTAAKADNEIMMTFVPWVYKDAFDFRGIDIADVRRLSDRHTIGLGFSFLDKRKVDFGGGNSEAVFETLSFEVSARIAYGYRFSKHWSAGLTYKQGFTRQPEILVRRFAACDEHSISTMAFDLGLHYSKEIKLTRQEQLFWQFGFSLNNLGPHVNYDNDRIGGIENFVRIGGLLGHKILQKNGNHYQFAFMYQTEKSLINGSKGGRNLNSIANKGKLLHKLGIELDIPIGSKAALGIRMAYQNGLRTLNEVDGKGFSRGLNFRINQFYIDFSQRKLINPSRYDEVVVPMMIGVGFKHQMNKNSKAFHS